MSQKKTLVLFTSTFPYGDGEQFIETEIRYLADAFEHVYIYPLKIEGEKRAVPANVTVVKNKLYQPYSRIKMLLTQFFRLRRIIKTEQQLSPHRGKYSTAYRHHLNYLMHRVNDARWLRAELEKYNHEHTVLYSYWFNHWGQVLSLVKDSGLAIRFVTRIHGGDFDESRKKQSYFPFRYFEMQNVDGVYPISSYGLQYMKHMFPDYKGVLKKYHLGVDEHGINPEGDESAFRIVSCSYLIPLKRVHLIIEALAHLNIPVEWTHFGDGKLKNELRSRAYRLPGNIKWTFRGSVANADILKYYASEPVDLFINVSELEGIPVSIMEAISAGIPVVGCRTGGVPEIVTEQTGFLLEKDFKTADLVNVIRNYQSSSAEQKAALRNSVRKFWHETFDASVNYPAFIYEITQP